MITKNTFVASSSIIISALLLTQIYSFKNRIDQSKSINLSAFINLTENVKNLNNKNADIKINAESRVDTKEIIKIIDSEITKKIRRTRYSLYNLKDSNNKSNTVISKVVTKSEAAIINDLSLYEINNSNLINLYALSVEKMAFTKFNYTDYKIASNDEKVKEEEIKDEVAVAQSSTVSTQAASVEKVNTLEVALPEAENNKDEDLVVFDYSDKSDKAVKTIDQQLYERPLSEAVKHAINREIGSTPEKNISALNTQIRTQEVNHQAVTKNIAKVDNQEIDLNSEENITYDYSSKKNTNKPTKDANTEENPFAAVVSTQESKFTINANEINLNTQKSSQLSGFEFVPDYDRAERNDDQGSGQIELGYSLGSDMNTQTGIIQAQGMISTRVELNLEGKANYIIPLINEEGMQQFLQKKGLSIEGNLVMLAINSAIIDTEIDSKYAEKIYFDKNFKQKTTGNGSSFVMYAGVKSGNILIRYLLGNNEVAQKIIYVSDGEMYFESAEFKISARETYAFTTRNLLGQKSKELVVDAENIKYFGTNITSKKKALNAYELKIPTLVSGMRKYLEFKHLNESVFLGLSSQKEIEIPSNEFIGKVLEMNQISSLKDRCVVQVNLQKDLREIKASGKNKSGEMFVETSYLDKDGNFSHDSEMAEKAFILGDLEGMFNVRLDYTDGSTEFLKTFCTEGSYLVEQL